MSNKIITVPEAAKMLHVSRQTLFNWNRDGVLRHRKIGNRILYYESDIYEALKQQS